MTVEGCERESARCRHDLTQDADRVPAMRCPASACLERMGTRDPTLKEDLLVARRCADSMRSSADRMRHGGRCAESPRWHVANKCHSAAGQALHLYVAPSHRRLRDHTTMERDSRRRKHYISPNRSARSTSKCPKRSSKYRYSGHWNRDNQMFLALVTTSGERRLLG